MIPSLKMASNRGGVQRVLTKLNRSIENGDYYEAHQMYRTLYFRYVGQQKFVEAVELLYNGSSLLLQHSQHGSGVDLALLLVEVLNKATATVNDDIIEKISHLHSMIKTDHVERPNFANQALRWSSQGSGSGHPYLHQKLAMTFWREKTYSAARHHFLHSHDGEGCALMLVEYHVTSGYPSEVDLFIAQAVLQYLCLSNKATAESCLSNYTKKHPQVEQGPPYVRPLLNFLWMLLLACDTGKLTLFTILCEQYQTSLSRDPTYNEYLDRIGQLFFGVPPPQNPSRGLLGNLMSSLFGMGMDEDDDDEEDAEEATGVSAATFAGGDVDLD